MVINGGGGGNMGPVSVIIAMEKCIYSVDSAGWLLLSGPEAGER